MQSPTPNAIKNLRSAAELTVSEAAGLVYTSPRTWTNWEAGTRKMDPALFQLVITRLTMPSNEALHSLGVAKVELTEEAKNMIVVVKRSANDTQPIDVVSQSNFLACELKDDVYAVISSLAVERSTGKPYVHRTTFKLSDNEHVIKATSSWKAAL